MDTLSPEILHVICACLDIENVLRFRLVNKVFADIGAAYMLPEVSFYMFDEDFKRLRAIAAHPIIAKHVRSLTYFGEVLDNQKVNLHDFVRDARRNQPAARTLFGQVTQDYTLPQLHKLHKEYEAVMKAQQFIIDNHTDVVCLKEVIPKFTSLRQASMSSGNEFYDGYRPTRKIRESPFRGSPLWPGNDLEPQGKRHLNGLIAGLIGSNCQLESFRAGVIDWKFFRNFDKIPDNFAQTLKYLKRIELHVDAEPGDNTSSIGRCRRAMQEGIIRKLLKPLQYLEVMHMTLYPVEWVDEEWPAELADIIAPGHKWPALREVHLGGFKSNRHEVMRFLELHKGTLESLCLRDVSIGDTSWWKFLPDVRNKLNLKESCICGDIIGGSEDEESSSLPTEYWSLPTTEEARRNRQRDSINNYCRGPQHYPDEVPLKKETVDKNWVKYVCREDESSNYNDDYDEDYDDYGDHMDMYGPDPTDGYWDDGFYGPGDYLDDETDELEFISQMLGSGITSMMGLDGFDDIDDFEGDGVDEDDEDDDDDSMPDLIGPGTD